MATSVILGPTETYFSTQFIHWEKMRVNYNFLLSILSSTNFLNFDFFFKDVKIKIGFLLFATKKYVNVTFY